MQEVIGSIPIGSTTFRYVSAASPSSRGLGHNPFTVATGVRIPVGTPLPRDHEMVFEPVADGLLSTPAVLYAMTWKYHVAGARSDTT